MNKKGHFAYNLGIWLGLLSETPLVRLQSRTPENHKILWFFLFLRQYIDFELRGKSKNC